MKIDWIAIRNFGRVKYFSIAYVAIIGILIAAEVYQVIDDDHAYPEFALSLKLFFLSSLCYTVAIALYQYFCPRIIQQYRTEEEYVNAVHDVYERAHLYRKTEIVLANLLDTQNYYKSRIEQLQKNIAESQASKNDPYQRELTQLIDSLYPNEESVNAVHDDYERAHPDKRTEIVQGNTTESQAPKNDPYQQELTQLIDSLYPDCLHRFLVQTYQNAKKKYAFAMYPSGALYFLGTLVLLYLLVENGIKVFQA